MKIKRLLSILLILSCCLFTTSCWSNKEINELLLINIFGLDKIGDDYIVTLQVINPGQLAYKSSKTPSTISTYTERGKSLLGAFKKIASKVPRKVYTSHLKLILIGEDFAREGIAPMMDITLREHQLRANFNIAIAKNSSAEDVLKTITKYSSVQNTRIEDTILLSEKTWAPVYNSTLYPFLHALSSKGKQLTLPGVELVFNDAFSHKMENAAPSILISSMGVFNDDKLLGWLTPEESLGLSFLSDKLHETFLDVSFDKASFSVDLYQSKTKITYTIDETGVHFNVDVKTRGSINAVNKYVQWKEPDIYLTLEDNCNRKIQSYIDKALSKIQLYYESDVVGFGEILHKYDNKYWQNIKGGWNTVFTSLNINYTISTEIDRSDKILNTIDLGDD